MWVFLFLISGFVLFCFIGFFCFIGVFESIHMLQFYKILPKAGIFKGFLRGFLCAS